MKVKNVQLKYINTNDMIVDPIIKKTLNRKKIFNFTNQNLYKK